MKIELIQYECQKTPLFTRRAYKYKPFTTCCSKIFANNGIMITNENVEFDSRDESESKYHPKVCIISNHLIDDFDGSYTETRSYPIQYCPYCGEKIDISVVETQDISEKYKKLISLRDELGKKIRATDSKKETELYHNQQLEITKKINNFYDITEIKE